ncbi:histone acetyltransferase type B catalytic subunit [Saccoglossus kowalevskii]|uniref:Histone acetyltransferase type B catalytic subunit n=1 Tax=Saccoglossus kowalevskii TaxID=10224 RepID=A0ABM0GGT3_SACKO|nr:histone acetyltransferase type B catalytic subunit [Saccoglossus kowalevskii]
MAVGIAEISIMRTSLEQYVTSANDAIHIKLVKTPSDIDDDSKNFHPEFTHQLFGQSENIFGYKNLKIQLYYSAGLLNLYLGKTCSEKLDPTRLDNIPADDIAKVIIEKLGVHPTDSLDKFRSELSKEDSFTPFGDLLHSYSVHKNGEDTQFEIYKCDTTTPGFIKYHERLQTFLWWFIDAVSYINIDDDRWIFYVVYERSVINGKPQHSVVGYCTVYKYYAYPTKIRPRISQMLILPPYQRQGHGAQLLEAIYIDHRQNPTVLDITVEDPSEEFICLRDYVDCKVCMHLASFSTECLQEGFTEDMAQEAQVKLKINQKQARRVYEILRLRVTDESNANQFKEYRLDIKKRLNIPYQREKSDMEKMKKALKPEELAATMAGQSLQERHNNLEKMFQELLVDYRKVVERLARS